MMQRRRPDREDYFAIGVLATITFVIWCAYTYQECGTVLDRCAFDPLKEWQPLIAGLSAVFAALFSISQVRKHRTHSRARTAEAYRASLPLVVSQIADLLEKDAEKLLDCLEKTEETERHRKPEFDWPADSELGLEVVRGLIEFDDSHSKEQVQLVRFLAKLQIYRARRRPGHREDIGLRRNIQGLATDCIDLYALASEFFPYSRPLDLGKPSVSFEAAFNAANILKFWNHGADGVFDRLKRIHEIDSQ